LAKSVAVPDSLTVSVNGDLALLANKVA